MKRLFRPALPWLLAAAFLAAGWWGWHEHRELRRMQATGMTPRVRSDLQARLWTLQKQNRALAAELAALRCRLGPPSDRDILKAANGAGGRAGTASKGHGALSPFRRALLTVLQDPQSRKLWMAQQDGRIDQTYGDLLKQLNLSPATAAKFRSLLLDKQVALLDVLGAIQQQGLTGADARAAVHELLGQTQKQINGNLRDLLGAADYRQYRVYAQTVPQRSEVAELQIELQQSGTPLQDYQSSQLVDILAQDAAAQRHAARAAGSPVPKVTVPGASLTGLIATVPISDNAVTAARNVLTPAQARALQQLQQEQHAQQIIRNLVRQARNAAATGPNG